MRLNFPPIFLTSDTHAIIIQDKRAFQNQQNGISVLSSSLHKRNTFFLELVFQTIYNSIINKQNRIEPKAIKLDNIVIKKEEEKKEVYLCQTKYFDSCEFLYIVQM